MSNKLQIGKSQEQVSKRPSPQRAVIDRLRPVRSACRAYSRVDEEQKREAMNCSTVGDRMRRWGVAIAALIGLSAPVAYGQTVTYIHTDAMGSPVATTDASGNLVETSEYAPYGELLNRPVKDGPGYTGHVEDAATDLTYMQQRYYDPTCGCFLSADPVTAYSKGDMRFFNRYAYAFNNPYRFTDPDGRQSWSNTGTANAWPAVQQACGGSNSCEQEVAGDLAKSEAEMASATGGAGLARGLIGGFVSRFAAREAGMSLAQANKINHIFSQARHNLGGLAKAMGGEVKAFKAIENATAKAIDASKAGKFETVVKVSGQQVTVRGNVVDGQIKIGTAFIKPPPPPVKP